MVGSLPAAMTPGCAFGCWRRPGDKFPASTEEAPMTPKLPASWRAHLADEFDKPYFHKLQEFLRAERRQYTVYPPEKEVYSALQYTPYEAVNVFLLGQDPYHDANQAHGLAFSVRPGVRPP